MKDQKYKDVSLSRRQLFFGAGTFFAGAVATAVRDKHIQV